MKFLREFCAWLRRMFFPNDFDTGYEWAKRELYWGRTSDDLLMQCDSVYKTNFDRGVEKAARDHLGDSK